MTHHTDAERADCPVCGGKPFIRRSHDADGMRWSHVECKSCGLRTRGKWAASSSDECPIFFQEVWEEWPRRAPAAPVPQGWIDPNDKAQKQYLPHIGERVLFNHDGRVYLGKHTGGSFKAEYPFGKTFGTWDCMWMYPSALDAAAPQPPEAGCSVSNGETKAAPVELPEPQAEIEVRSMKTYLGLSIHEWRDTLPDGAYNIYTEQQVRELLANHGIQERST